MESITMKQYIFILLIMTFFVNGRAQSLQSYKLKDLESRAATAENPLAEKGKGGMLHGGLKGRPALIDFKKGTTEVLLDTEGPGMVRHIWFTLKPNSEMEVRNIILKMYWENSDVPSVEVPLGDFFGVAHGAKASITSMFVSVQPNFGYNCDIPMPFKKHALITVTNESDSDLDFFFYQIDFTLGDKIKKDDGRFHASFRKQNPTRYGHDYTILETEGAKGVFIGCVLGIRPLTPGWWGEGEVKMYIDSDSEYPTICGTGLEDYIGAAWGMRRHNTPLRGAPLVESNFVSMYRFHLNDPIYFKNNIRIDIQQMGLLKIDEAREIYGDSLIFRKLNHPRRDPENVLHLRSDDVCSVAYWYQYPLIKERESIPNKEQRSENLYSK